MPNPAPTADPKYASPRGGGAAPVAIHTDTPIVRTVIVGGGGGGGHSHALNASAIGPLTTCPLGDRALFPKERLSMANRMANRSFL